MQVARLELVVFDYDRVLLGHFISPLVNVGTAVRLQEFAFAGPETARAWSGARE
jgi:hypothetical protein